MTVCSACDTDHPESKGKKSCPYWLDAMAKCKADGLTDITPAVVKARINWDLLAKPSTWEEAFERMRADQKQFQSQQDKKMEAVIKMLQKSKGESSSPVLMVIKLLMKVTILILQCSLVKKKNDVLRGATHAVKALRHRAAMM